MENENSKVGKIIQVIGAVVDAEFPPGSTPEIYDALEVSYKSSDAEEEKKLDYAEAALELDALWHARRPPEETYVVMNSQFS